MKHKFRGRAGAVSILGVATAFGSLQAVADDAQDTEARQDAIIIEGSRLDQAKSEIGSSVSVVTAEQIELVGSAFAIEALGRVPGVSVNTNGAFGGSANVRIRGAGSEQTLVLIDGMPVNDPTTPGGGYDFARLDTDAIERIEVLKGPQSTLWGTDAIGGVVAITTREAAQGLSGTLFGEYGSFQTKRAGAALEAGSDTARLRLATTATDSRGISKADAENGNTERDGYQSWTLSARGDVDLPAGFNLDGSILYTDAETEFDGFAPGAQGSVGDADERSETETLSSYFTLTIPQLFNGLDQSVSVGRVDLSRDNFSDGVSSFSAEGERTTYRYEGKWMASDMVTLGFGAEREESESGDQDTSIDGLFGLVEVKPTAALTLTAGLRSDDHERFGSETTARLAAAWKATDDLVLRASWGEGFKAPTVFQTTFFCCGADAPNPNLMAETSDAFDVGADWSALDDRLDLSISYFQQDVENLIVFEFGIGGYRNEAQVDLEGVELTSRYQLTETVAISGDFAWIDAVTGDGQKLSNLPEFTADLGLEFDPGGPLSGAVFVRHNGEETDFSGPVVDSWTRVDATLRYALNARVELYGRVENLLDEHYQQVLGYGTPGVSGTIGLKVRY